MSEALQTSETNQACSNLPASPEQIEAKRLVSCLYSDAQGIICLGSDGVMRSLDAQYKVIDAVGFPPAQVEAWTSCYSDQERADYRNKNGAWVDGTKISRKAMLEPEPSLIPRALTAEEQEQLRKEIEDHSHDDTSEDR